MLAWGATYGTCMAVGLIAFRAEPAFWVPAAVVTTLPLTVGALRANAGASMPDQRDAPHTS